MKFNWLFVLLVFAAFVLAVWFNNWLYFLLIFAVAGILVALPNVHLVLTKEAGPVHHEVIDYIRKAREHGLSDDKIEASLKMSGWEDHEIALGLHSA